MEKPPNSFHTDIFFAESVPAGAKQRYLAATIDTILLTILVGFLAAVLGKSDSKSGVAVLNGFVTALYFVITQLKFGGTLGKKIMKIQVVSIEGELTAQQLVVRETIGRALSFIFMLGYLWMFFNGDRRGWHDYLGKTRVISTDPAMQEAQPGAWRKFALTTGTMAALCGVAIYLALFSALPVKKIGQNLELAGYQVINPHGSLATGINFDSVSVSGTANDFTIQNARIKLDLMALLEQKIVVKQITIGSGELALPDVSPVALMAALAQPKPKGSIDESKPEVAVEESPGAKKNGPKEILLQKVDFANLKLKFGTKIVNVERFFIDNLLVNEKGAGVARVWLKSDAFDVDLGNLVFDKSQIRAERLKGNVKKSLLPQYLAGDLDFEGGFELDTKTRRFSKLGLGLCERRLQVRREGDGFAVQTYDLTPSKCLASGLPLYRLNTEVRLMPPRFKPEVKSASVNVRNVPFKWMSTHGFVHTRGSRYFIFNVDSGTVMQLVMGGQPKLTISSSSEDDKEWLSQLYFDRPSGQLLASELSILDADQAFFKSPGAFQMPGLEPGITVRAPSGFDSQGN